MNTLKAGGWGAVCVLLAACATQPVVGGPLWVGPDRSETCAPIASYSHMVWGTYIENRSSDVLTINRVDPVSAANLDVLETSVVRFDPSHGLLVQTLPLAEEQLQAWAQRTKAEKAVLEPGASPSAAVEIVLELQVDDGATEAGIDALKIQYADTTGVLYQQTTNNALRVRQVC